MKIFFWYDLQNSPDVFFQTLGAIFLNQTTLGAISAQIFKDFAKIFKDFAQMFKDFAWIFDK